MAAIARREKCDRPLMVDAIGWVGPGHGDMNMSVIVVILSMPYTYGFAIGGFWLWVRSPVFGHEWDGKM